MSRKQNLRSQSVIGGNQRKRDGRRKRNISTVTLRNSSSKIPDVMPKEWFCYNKYISQIIGYTSASNAYGAFAYYINSPFTPEVTGTDTSSAIGTSELAAMYANSLVLAAKVDLEVVNEEDFEIVVAGAPSTYALQSLIGSASEALQIAELPWGKSLALGRADGMNRGRLSFNVNLSRLVGNRSFYVSDQNWIGLSGALPINKLYVTFGIAALSGNLLAEGVTFRLSVRYKVRWMNRKYDDITTRKPCDPVGGFHMFAKREKASSEKKSVDKNPRPITMNLPQNVVRVPLGNSPEFTT